MADENVSIKVGFVADTAGNRQAISEIEKVKAKVLDVQKSVKETSNTKLNITETAGNIGGGAGKIRGIADMFGGGELAGLANDAGDAIEGVSQLGSTLVSLGPVGIAAGVAVAAVVLVLGDLAQGAQEQADAITATFDAQRAVFDEIAGGATSADIQDSIAQLQFRRELEKQTLAESTASYQAFVEGIREAFGIFAPLVEGILQVIDPREEALFQQQEKSQGLIKESEARERAYNEALEQGLTAKADAKAAEGERQKANEKAARDAEATQRKAEAAAEKATREAEQRAKEDEQLRLQQADAAAKYRDTQKKITQTAIDNIKDLNTKFKDAALDGRNKLISDLNGLSQKANDDEISSAIKANRAEQGALKDHQRAVADILKKGQDAEADARENRNFIDLVRARREQQNELNGKPGEFEDGAADRRQAFEEEREDRQRGLEIARRDRQQAAQQEDAERKAGLERALRDNQTAKQRQLRDAATAYQSEQATFARHLQSMLMLRGQAMNAETQLLQAHLGAVSGGGRPSPAPVNNRYSNIQRAYNTTNNISVVGSGGAIGAMRAAGYGR